MLLLMQFALCFAVCSQHYVDCSQVMIHNGLYLKVSFAVLYLCKLDYSRKHVSFMIFVFLFF